MDLVTNTPPIPFYVDAGRLRRSQQQRFFILPTPSMTSPQPTLFIIGSTGNEYKIYFSLDYISCSCDDYSTCTSFPQKLCKHILFLLRAISYTLTSGTLLLLHPHQILHLFQTSTSLVQKWFVPPKAEILCRSHHTARCAECHFILSGTVIVCTHCASSFHHYCQQPNQACASCGSSNSSYVTTVRCGKHRNLSGILLHCGLNQSASTAPTTNASTPTVRNIRGHCASTTVLPTTNSSPTLPRTKKRKTISSYDLQAAHFSRQTTLKFEFGTV